MSRKLKGALIGFGNVAANAHVAGFEKSGRFEIPAIVEPCSKRAAEAEKRLPGARIFSTLNALLGKCEVDFVDICTPPCCHLEAVTVSLAAGLHVLCEKPLVTAVSELDEILTCLEKSQKTVYTVNNWKYAPIWIKVFEIIHGGAIGRIRSVELHVLRMQNSGGGATNWRKCPRTAGGGIMVDHGWHHLYILLSLMGGMPDSVSAKMNFAQNSTMIDETAEVEMLFGDAAAALSLTWQADRRRNFGVITGDRGQLLLNDDHIVLQVSGQEGVKTCFDEPLSAGSHHPEWMMPVMDGFYRCIESGDVLNENLKEAVNCVKLIELSYQSHRSGSLQMTV